MRKPPTCRLTVRLEPSSSMVSASDRFPAPMYINFCLFREHALFERASNSHIEDATKAAPTNFARSFWRIAQLILLAHKKASAGAENRHLLPLNLSCDEQRLFSEALQFTTPEPRQRAAGG